MAPRKTKSDTLVLGYDGPAPVGNVLHARVKPVIQGTKMLFSNRVNAVVEAAGTVNVPEGFKLCFSVHDSLANKGMLALNAPGNFKSGKVFVNLLNAGREIVEVKDGDPLMVVWLEKDQDFVWEVV